MLYSLYTGINQLGVSRNRAIPKSSILLGFSIINQPFWGSPIYGNPQLYMGLRIENTTVNRCRWGNHQVVDKIFIHAQMLHVWNIYLHLDHFGVNVGKYSIHGASGTMDIPVFIPSTQGFLGFLEFCIQLLGCTPLINYHGGKPTQNKQLESSHRKNNNFLLSQNDSFVLCLTIDMIFASWKEISTKKIWEFLWIETCSLEAHFSGPVGAKRLYSVGSKPILWLINV